METTTKLMIFGAELLVAGLTYVGAIIYARKFAKRYREKNANLYANMQPLGNINSNKNKYTKKYTNHNTKTYNNTTSNSYTKKNTKEDIIKYANFETSREELNRIF